MINNRKRWIMCISLLCAVLSAALPAAALAAPAYRLTCGLSFDSAHDSTEAHWRGIWSMPTTGGDAILVAGVYSEAKLTSPSFGLMEEPQEHLEQPPILSSSSHVMIDIYDWMDRSRKLFTFEGTLAELMALSGGQTAFYGPYGVSVRIPLSVPAGSTWWAGRMEISMGNKRCHADIWLLQGFAPVLRVK